MIVILYAQINLTTKDKANDAEKLNNCIFTAQET